MNTLVYKKNKMNLKLIYFILRTLVAFSLLFLSFARLPSLVTLDLAYLPFEKFFLPIKHNVSFSDLLCKAK